MRSVDVSRVNLTIPSDGVDVRAAGERGVGTVLCFWCEQHPHTPHPPTHPTPPPQMGEAGAEPRLRLADGF